MDNIQIKVLNNSRTMAKLIAECMNSACSLMDVNARQIKLEDQSIHETTDYYDEMELGATGMTFLSELCAYIVDKPLRLLDPIDLFPEDVAMEATYSALGWLDVPEWLVNDIKAHVLTILKNNNHTYLLSPTGLDANGQQINTPLAIESPMRVEYPTYRDEPVGDAVSSVLAPQVDADVQLQRVNLDIRKDVVIVDTIAPMTSKEVNVAAHVGLPSIAVPRH